MVPQSQLLTAFLNQYVRLIPYLPGKQLVANTARHRFSNSSPERPTALPACRNYGHPLSRDQRSQQRNVVAVGTKQGRTVHHPVRLGEDCNFSRGGGLRQERGQRRHDGARPGFPSHPSGMPRLSRSVRMRACLHGTNGCAGLSRSLAWSCSRCSCPLRHGRPRGPASGWCRPSSAGRGAARACSAAWCLSPWAWWLCCGWYAVGEAGCADAVGAWTALTSKGRSPGSTTWRPSSGGWPAVSGRRKPPLPSLTRSWSSAGTYSPTTTTTPTSAAITSPARNPDRQRDRLIKQLNGLGYRVRGGGLTGPDHRPTRADVVTVGALDIPPPWVERLTADGRLVVPSHCRTNAAGTDLVRIVGRVPGSSGWAGRPGRSGREGE